jgi:hypothetical protein
MTVFTFYISTRRPLGNDPGAIWPGHYTVDGDVVTLTDGDGCPIPSGRTELGFSSKVTGEETADSVAKRLLWRHYRATKSGSDFNRPLNYPPIGIV